MSYAPWMGNTGWDGAEMAANRERRKALRLLDRIVEEIGTQEFTERELFDAVNPLTKEDAGFGGTGERWTTVRFGRSHLRTLVSMGLVDRQGKVYEAVRFPE